MDLLRIVNKSMPNVFQLKNKIAYFADSRASAVDSKTGDVDSKAKIISVYSKAISANGDLHIILLII